ncbi:hypothetical protein ACFSPU_02120 [Haoranjiania flava]|uniref:Uncharacterized protein n=1 Tax=Haoranjiania flava TaxID=1856322 RepID=A0AAE3LIV8_9BACT|nr:hypothetical protein [Haoranjiania flava]MCU7693027.1 hypothetical protein [Haoranjiania flava]
MENQLPNVVIANLFKNGLVIVDENPPDKKEVIPHEDKKKSNSENDTEKNWWLGNNRKKVAIVLAGTDAKFLGDAELNFLLTILKACNLTAEDIAIVNIAHTPKAFTEIQQALSAETAILFGVAPMQVGIQVKFPLYTPSAFEGCKLLFAAPLEALNGNTPAQKTEKGNLWTALKKLFGI